MKKCDDNSILKKAAELNKEQKDAAGGLSVFRKQFGDYQRAKGNIDTGQQVVSRPYHEVLYRHKKAEGD
jgi:hypothetical protein